MSVYIGASVIIDQDIDVESVVSTLKWPVYGKTNSAGENKYEAMASSMEPN